MMKNRKGQMGFPFIMGIVMLVVAILLITSFWPVIQDQFDGLRDQSELNCVTTVTEDLCETDEASPCYNSTAGNTHGTTCAMLGIGPPLILIMLILGAIGMLIGGGAIARAPQQYPQY